MSLHKYSENNEKKDEGRAWRDHPGGYIKHCMRRNYVEK
jgi:hypothetical protein